MTMIHNSAAYENGKERNIRNNARKGRAARWHEAYGDDAKLIEAFLHGYGEFEDSKVIEDGQWVASNPHPVRKAAFNGFLFNAMVEALHEWGGLTEKQTAATLKMISDADARVKEWAARDAARAATSKWIGEIKVRRDFTLTLNKLLDFDSQFGVCYIHLMTDTETGADVVYKGSKVLGEEGETFTVKATVKEHGERNGVKQTIISRPA